MPNNVKFILSENIISSILDSFSKSNIKVMKCSKKQVSAIKTNKVQSESRNNTSYSNAVVTKL